MNHSFLTRSINLRSISILTILEFKNLVLNYIFEVFMNFLFKWSFNKIETFWIKLAWQSKIIWIDKIFNSCIFWIIFKISFKVVSVHLLFFSETTKEIGVVFNPSLLFTIKHSLFPSFIVFRVRKFTGFKFFNFIEYSVKFCNRLFNIKPCFIKTSIIRNLNSNSLFFHLSIDSTESLVHSV